jgi:hypothetical protein
MTNNEDIEFDIDKETGDLLIKGKINCPGPYIYYFKENDD